jgi:broad specificity phosphatase PhoE
MAQLLFITHPEVVVDPQVDVRKWHLSETGIARMAEFSARAEVSAVKSIWASAETKALDAAGILAAKLGLQVEVEAALGENDRDATGFLPPDEFEQVADAFFAQPDQSIRGWERAIDAQDRIARAVSLILAQHETGDIAIVAHGAVGSLLLCRCLDQPISRSADQPFQGHFWRAALEDMTILHGWRSIAPRRQRGAQRTGPALDT